MSVQSSALHGHGGGARRWPGALVPAPARFGGRPSPAGPQTCARWQMEQPQLYFASRGVGTTGGELVGSESGGRRLSRASSISSHMARHRGTWKQPAGERRACGLGDSSGSRMPRALAVPLSSPLTFERTSLDGEGDLPLSIQIAKPLPVLGITKL
jgi:hypothetical protein